MSASSQVLARRIQHFVSRIETKQIVVWSSAAFVLTLVFSIGIAQFEVPSDNSATIVDFVSDSNAIPDPIPELTTSAPEPTSESTTGVNLVRHNPTTTNAQRQLEEELRTATNYWERRQYFEQQQQAERELQMAFEQRRLQSQAAADDYLRQAQESAEYERQSKMNRYNSRMSRYMGVMGIDW